MIDDEIWVSQSQWDRVPEEARKAMQSVSPVHVLTNEEWKELSQKLKEVTKKKDSSVKE